LPAQPPFSKPNAFGDLVLSIFLIQSHGTTDHLGWNAPSWSISCEAAEYVAFALASLSDIIKDEIVSSRRDPDRHGGLICWLCI
jgi:hypothetical protein